MFLHHENFVVLNDKFLYRVHVELIEVFRMLLENQLDDPNKVDNRQIRQVLDSKIF